MNKQLSGGGKRASSQPACSPLFHSHGDYFPHMLQNAILLCSAHLNYFINRMPLNKGLLNFEIHTVILHSITLRSFVQFQLRSKGGRFSAVPQSFRKPLRVKTAPLPLPPLFKLCSVGADLSLIHKMSISLSTEWDSKVNEHGTLLRVASFVPRDFFEVSVIRINGMFLFITV